MTAKKDNPKSRCEADQHYHGVIFSSGDFRLSIGQGPRVSRCYIVQFLDDEGGGWLRGVAARRVDEVYTGLFPFGIGWTEKQEVHLNNVRDALSNVPRMASDFVRS